MVQNLESEEEKMTEISYKQKLEQLLEKCPHDKFYNNCMQVVENLSTLQKVWIRLIPSSPVKIIAYESIPGNGIGSVTVDMVMGISFHILILAGTLIRIKYV